MNTDYTLAKELKDAGFKQEGNGIYDCACENGWSLGEVDPKTDELYKECPKGEAYIPTLEELIEACGDSFDDLHAVKDRGVILGWAAHATDSRSSEWFAKAKHKKETVARLWLALNTKE